MSLQVLTQVYDETRRLAIAGSVVASGDFRLKKLIPPLEQSGAKAPVFAKVAEAAKAVVESNEKTSADALLELTTLVNAILYTQGETGLAGEMRAIETIDLGAPTTQTSARTLKPLLEALTSTGSGRWELIRDAHTRGLFRDFRLIQPALAGIDDGYGEIADFLAEKVLPMYGKAILPDLKAKLDLKGRAGHPRRLKLMHLLDPEGTRAIVKQALDEGSKETRVAAIECLGGSTDDLSYLLEQASARAIEVRQAAYQSLANMENDEACEALKKAVAGKDLGIAFNALQGAKNTKLIEFILQEADRELAAVSKTKGKKEISEKIGRARSLVNSVYGRTDLASEAFLLKTFARRAEIADWKGDNESGADFNLAVVSLLASGSEKMVRALVAEHASLSTDELVIAFQAARRRFSSAELYETFSPYVKTKAEKKRGKKDEEAVKSEALCQAMGQTHYYHWSSRGAGELPNLEDPRWLDLAVEAKRIDLIRTTIRPGHTAANEFLASAFDEALKNSKEIYDLVHVLGCMFQAKHPKLEDAFVAALEKHAKRLDYFGYWFGTIVADLPKSAIPRLEALIPNLSDRAANTLLDLIQQLREKA